MSHRHTPCDTQRLLWHIALSIAFGIGVLLNGGCRTWRMSPWESNALAEIANLKDIEKIYVYAKESTFPRVRKRAAERICEMRSKYQKQQDYLKDLAESDDNEVRHIAATGITHQGHLESLAWESKHSEVRCIAVVGITSQNCLEKLTKDSPHNEVRRIAVTRIANETLRVKTAFGDRDLSVRDSAASKITNHDTLITLFLEGKVSDGIILRLPRDKRLHGEKAQKRLASVVAASANAMLVRGTAFVELTDEDLLASYNVQLSMAELLCHSFDKGNVDISQKAKDMLFDPDALVYLAATMRDRKIRDYCVGRIGDNDSLYELVRKVRDDPFLTQSAIIKITDQGVLGNIAQNKVLTDAEHMTAIKKLDNGKILRMLENDNNLKIRDAATERLKQLLQE